MVTCPWCGTNHITFQTNCVNCGGALPLPVERAPEPGIGEITAPPPPPRDVPRNYYRRTLSADPGAITGGIFLLLGVIFGVVGFGLTIAVVTAFVGLPFLGLGILFLGGGIGLLFWRYQKAGRVEKILREGATALGEIADVYPNLQVQVNGRHPWTVLYRYDVTGLGYEGKMTTLIRPDLRQQPGKRVYVLYSPEEHAQSTIYPYPYGYHGV